MKTKQNSNNNKTSTRRKKNVCKLWALLKISKLRKQTHKELVPLLVLEEQAQVASKRLELITKYRANTLMLLLFCTVSGATIRQNFDFFVVPPLYKSYQSLFTFLPTPPPTLLFTFLEPLCLPVWLHRSFGYVFTDVQLKTSKTRTSPLTSLIKISLKFTPISRITR